MANNVAYGRLGDARRALTLLTTSDELEAAALADELEAENTRRRDAEKRVVAECEAMMAHYSLLDHKIIVLCGGGWNSGVIGLAASRLVTEYHYPVILLAENDGVCVGSCRSIPAVDIFKTLSSCADLMTRFGGHRQAAGLAVRGESPAGIRPARHPAGRRCSSRGNARYSALVAPCPAGARPLSVPHWTSTTDC